MVVIPQNVYFHFRSSLDIDILSIYQNQNQKGFYSHESSHRQGIYFGRRCIHLTYKNPKS